MLGRKGSSGEIDFWIDYIARTYPNMETAKRELPAFWSGSSEFADVCNIYGVRPR